MNIPETLIRLDDPDMRGAEAAILRAAQAARHSCTMRALLFERHRMYTKAEDVTDSDIKTLIETSKQEVAVSVNAAMSIK